MKGLVFSCFALLMLLHAECLWAVEVQPEEGIEAEDVNPTAELERLEHLLSDQDDIEKLKVIMGRGGIP